MQRWIQRLLRSQERLDEIWVSLPRHRTARFALFLNFVGTVLLFYSIQITSGKVSIVTGADGSTALCIGPRAFITLLPNGAANLIGPCPESILRASTAIITTEHPGFITFGFALLFFGFIIQYSLERPEQALPRILSDPQRKLFGHGTKTRFVK